jgi:hypothetical protein
MGIKLKTFKNIMFSILMKNFHLDLSEKNFSVWVDLLTEILINQIESIIKSKVLFYSKGLSGWHYFFDFREDAPDDDLRVVIQLLLSHGYVEVDIKGRPYNDLLPSYKEWLEG